MPRQGLHAQSRHVSLTGNDNLFDLITLNHADLAETPLRRDRGVRPDRRTEGSDAAYDATTLWYDAVQDGEMVHLTCPRLFNLGRHMRRGRWSVDGQPVKRPAIRNFYRHSIMSLTAPRGARRVTVEADGWRIGTDVAQTDHGRFAGLNCEMLISRDNRLEWIADKLRNHVRHHGLQGVLFLDNGSTEYAPDDVVQVLRDVGLKSGLVVSVPHPWGPVGKPGSMHRELYLQTAIYNAVRLRFLRGARAVLRMDIDETLTTPPDGSANVFDATVASRLGYIQFNGWFRYPEPASTPPFGFADHIWRKPEDRPGGGNWCVVPDGPLRRFQWRCHNLEGFPLTLLSRRPGGWYYDCQGITTGWKNPDRWDPGVPLEIAPEMAEFFASGGFSGADSGAE